MELLRRLFNFQPYNLSGLKTRAIIRRGNNAARKYESPSRVFSRESAISFRNISPRVFVLIFVVVALSLRARVSKVISRLGSESRNGMSCDIDAIRHVSRRDVLLLARYHKNGYNLAKSAIWRANISMHCIFWHIERAQNLYGIGEWGTRNIYSILYFLSFMHRITKVCKTWQKYARYFHFVVSQDKSKCPVVPMIGSLRKK